MESASKHRPIGLASKAVKELEPLQFMEQRVKQLESLVLEMRLEIEELRVALKPENQTRLDKMHVYQQRLDQMASLKESA